MPSNKKWTHQRITPNDNITKTQRSKAPFPHSIDKPPISWYCHLVWFADLPIPYWKAQKPLFMEGPYKSYSRLYLASYVCNFLKSFLAKLVCNPSAHSILNFDILKIHPTSLRMNSCLSILKTLSCATHEIKILLGMK